MTRREAEALVAITDFLDKRDTELANKLRDVVDALVAADAALDKRIAGVEEFLSTAWEPSATQPWEPEPGPLERLAGKIHRLLFDGGPIFHGPRH
jgi:hypothetical protein